MATATPASDQRGHRCKGGADASYGTSCEMQQGGFQLHTGESFTLRAAQGQVSQSSGHSILIFKISLNEATSSDLEAGAAVNRGWTGALQRCYQ